MTTQRAGVKYRITADVTLTGPVPEGGHTLASIAAELHYGGGIFDAVRSMEAIPECPYTFAHTRHWCGYQGCRDS